MEPQTERSDQSNFPVTFPNAQNSQFLLQIDFSPLFLKSQSFDDATDRKVKLEIEHLKANNPTAPFDYSKSTWVLYQSRGNWNKDSFIQELRKRYPFIRSSKTGKQLRARYYWMKRVAKQRSEALETAKMMGKI